MSKIDHYEFPMLVVSSVELVVTDHWPKLWARTAKGKLSSTGISAESVKPKDGEYRYLTRILKRKYRISQPSFQNDSLRSRSRSWHRPGLGDREGYVLRGPLVGPWFHAPALASFCCFVTCETTRGSSRILWGESAVWPRALKVKL